MKKVFIIIGIILCMAMPIATCAKVDVPQQVYVLTNISRSNVGLKGLAWNKSLAEDATIRAKEIATKKSHIRPDGTPYYTIDNSIMAENIAYNYTSADQIVYAWLCSPLHSANLLCASFNNIGVGMYVQNGNLYVVQEFS